MDLTICPRLLNLITVLLDGSMDKKKKILLIGPVYPYKGGIAHYTGLLYRALSKENDVYMMSYKLQYPKFLFKKEQKDYSNDTFKIENTDFYINTANPFSWIATAAKIRRMKPDLVIIQWWHPYFAPCYWMICKLLGKIKVLFTCHNVFPHERFPMDRFLTKHVLANGDYFIVQSSQDETDLKTIKKNAVYRKTVHPTYNAFKLQNLTMEQGREQLGINADEKILLFFGFVREYKGLKHLLRAMPQVTEKLSDVKLLVVGDFAGDKDDYLKIIQELKLESCVNIYDGYITDKEVEKFFAASDLVVLPYESATQSGIVQIAYGFEKPVIATDVGGLPEVVLNDKTGYIVAPQRSDELSKSIVNFFSLNKQESFKKGIQEEAYRYSWECLIEQVNILTKS